MAAKKTPTKKKAPKKSLASWFLLLANLVVVMMLLASYAAWYISPVKACPLAFAGLFYPIILFINLFFIILWMVFLKKYFLISLIVVVMGYQPFRSFVGMGGQGHLGDPAGKLKVMTYNVRLFDLYNWKNESSKTTRNAIFDLISAESPDILFLQEYYSGYGKKADFADSICQKSGYGYHYVELVDQQVRSIPYGLATFSKYPLFNFRKLSFDNSRVNFLQACEMLVNDDTVTLMNLHFESIRFGQEDYNFVSDMANAPQPNENFKQNSGIIISKLKSAFQRRAKQADKVAAYLAESKYPVLLAGDFNDTPVSYAYKRIYSQLDDAFVDAGDGVGRTYAEHIPFLRIDYLFHSKAFTTQNIHVIKVQHSDHFPVTAHFNFSGK